MNELLTTEQAAILLGMHPGTLTNWRSTGRYDLPFIRIGRSIRYRRADVQAWIERRRTPAPDHAARS